MSIPIGLSFISLNVIRELDEKRRKRDEEERMKLKMKELSVSQIILPNFAW